MKIKKVKLSNIRKLQSLEVDFEDKNLIIGKNGVGKTTIGEAIYFSSLFKSFRASKFSDIVTFEQDNALISLTYEDKGIENTIKVTYFKNKKKLFFNNNEISDIYKLINKFPVLILSPENIDLINLSPAIRRKYIDRYLTQLNKDYLKTLVKYKKILKMKQISLKKDVLDEVYINLLSDELFLLNSLIVEKRIKILIEIEQEINKILLDVTNGTEQVSIIYNIHKENLEHEKLKNNEFMFRQVLKGSHLDNFQFYLNGKDMSLFASQGQKRLVTICFFLAQNKLLLKKKNSNALLIFDDVYLDLDNERQKRLMDTLSDNQIIYITTDKEKLNFLQNKEKFNIIEIT